MVRVSLPQPQVWHSFCAAQTSSTESEAPAIPQRQEEQLSQALLVVQPFELLSQLQQQPQPVELPFWLQVHSFEDGQQPHQNPLQVY